MKNFLSYSNYIHINHWKRINFSVFKGGRFLFLPAARNSTILLPAPSLLFSILFAVWMLKCCWKLPLIKPVSSVLYSKKKLFFFPCQKRQLARSHQPQKQPQEFHHDHTAQRMSHFSGRVNVLCLDLLAYSLS